MRPAVQQPPVQQPAPQQPARPAVQQHPVQPLPALWLYVHNAYTNHLVNQGLSRDEAAQVSEVTLRDQADRDALMHFALTYAENNIEIEEEQDAFIKQFLRLYQDVPQAVHQAQIIARPEPLDPIGAHTKTRINQAIQEDRVKFAYLDSPAKINAIIDHYIHLGPLPEDNILLAFAEKVCTDHYTAPFTNISVAIKRVKAVLEVMKNMHPHSTILNDEHYVQAVEQRSFVYQYIDLKGRDQLNDADFANALIDLKTVLGKRLNDPLALGENLTFRSAYNIKKFEKDAQDEENELTQAFNAKQAILKNRVDPGNNQDQFTIWVDNRVLPLYDEWNAGVAEINRIAATKAGDPVRLNYAKLTYEDIYSVFFNAEYVDPAGAAIVSIQDTLIRLARSRVSSITPYNDYNDYRNYEPGTAPENNEQAVFIHQANERLNSIIYRDADHFKARVKALFDKASPTEISVDIPRPEEPGHNPVIWNANLENAQFTVGALLVAALEGCDGGRNSKLADLENRYRDVLGTTQPRIKGMKAVASIVMKLKLDRIQESGGNPDTTSDNAFEEKATAPTVLAQRLRGPFGLLKKYNVVVAPFYGLPRHAKNNPVQIIKNMFLPRQPDRPYKTERVVRVKGVNYQPGIVNIPVAPHLTVKSLVEAVYNEFDRSLPHKFIEEFVNGDLRLLKDQNAPLGITTVDAADGVFIQEVEGKGRVRIGPAGKPAAKDEYTREMAFFMLEKMGYVQIDPQVKADVYEFDEDEERPGTTTRVRGVPKTLKDLIDEY